MFLKNKFDQIFTRLSVQPWFPAVSKVITWSAQSSLLCLVWTREIHHSVVVKLGLMFQQHSFVWAYHRSHGGKTLINTVYLITTWCKLLKWVRTRFTRHGLYLHAVAMYISVCVLYPHIFLSTSACLWNKRGEFTPPHARARALRPVDAEADNVGRLHPLGKGNHTDSYSQNPRITSKLGLLLSAGTGIAVLLTDISRFTRLN